ncbi:MAG: hypothetical protein QW701_03170 [Candidatus Nezhaarchaeales archaeon]
MTVRRLTSTTRGLDRRPKAVGYAELSNVVVAVWDDLNNFVASASGSGACRRDET